MLRLRAFADPERMAINANHVVLAELVNPGSKLAQLIVELKTKNPYGPPKVQA
jgi:hypothetical protein